MGRTGDILTALARWQEAIAPQLATHYPQLSDIECDRLLLHLNLGFICVCLRQREVDSLTPFSFGQWPSVGIHTYLCQQLQDDWFEVLPAEWLQPPIHVADNLLISLLHDLKAIPTTEAFDLEGMPLVVLLGQAYEQLQPMLVATDRAPRKSGGRYYTPWAIAHDMVQRAFDALIEQQPFHPHTPPYILDPACGGGIFLIAAYQYLLHQTLQHYMSLIELSTPPADLPIEKSPHGRWFLTFAERSRLLTHCIAGVDIDPQAVTVTQLGLWLHLLTTGLIPKHAQLPDLSQTIRCGNALIAPDYQFLSSDNTNSPFDWSTAFPDIMQSGGFDLVIGNPPYIDSEQMTHYLSHWRNYCVKHYQAAVGNWDLFCIFIEKALLLCKPKGIHSFIVPNKLASADYAATVRSLLSQTNSLLSIRDYSQVPVFSVAVYPLVYTVRRHPPNDATTVRCDRMSDLTTIASTYWLDYQTHFIPSTRPWLLHISQPRGILLDRLQHVFPSLADVASISGAATVTEAYALQSTIIDRACIHPADLKLVNSGTIDRYALLWGRKPLRYLGAQYLHPVIEGDRLLELSTKRYQQATQPKLIVAGMTRRLEVALDESGEFVAGKSTSIIRVDHPYQRLYLLGLLNSTLIHVYFKHLFGGNCLNGGYFRVGPPQLKQLPIPLLNWSLASDRQRGDRFIDLVQQRIAAQISSTSFQIAAQLDQNIDEIVYDLYALTDAQIATLTN